MGVPAHSYGEYKMSWNPHTFWTVKGINGAIKNFLLKNSFPKKKEKKFYKSFQRAGEAINAFSKIFIYEHFPRTIFVPSYL